MSYQEGINKGQTITTTLDLPNAVRDLVATLASDKRFRTFSRLVESTSLGEIWRGSSWTTLLVPTDDAFARLPPDQRVPGPDDVDQTQAFLERHAVRGYLKEADLRNGRYVKTLGGLTVRITHQDGETRANGTRLVNVDIACNNGIIHALDGMLSPE